MWGAVCLVLGAMVTTLLRRVGLDGLVQAAAVCAVLSPVVLTAALATGRSPS